MSEIKSTNCIQAPTNLKFPWSPNVYPNCFSNIERLGKWVGGTKILSTKDDPSSFFVPVKIDSIGSGAKGTHLYVVAHGWAPGLRSAVNQAKGNLQWWSTGAVDAQGLWESNWAWTGTKGSNLDIIVSPTGLLQQIEAYEQSNSSGANVEVLAFSWVDNSATVPINWKDDSTWSVAAISEAYTNLNGLRLADAIQKVTSKNFFSNSANKIHLLGHSHGTKVVTVACLELQKRGYHIDQLSVFDPPEEMFSEDINSANLLGFYFEKMKIQDFNQPAQSGSTFVDSYISYFGSGYAGSIGSPINNIAQIALDSSRVFSLIVSDLISQKHAYSATWYSNAAVGSKKYGDGQKGLDWPPVQPKSLSHWYQYFTDFSSESWEKQQWRLDPGKLDSNNSYDTFLYSNPSINIEMLNSDGIISGDPNTLLTLVAAPQSISTNSFMRCKFQADLSGLYGLSCEIQSTNIQAGDYIVITSTPPSEIDSGIDIQEITMVFDTSSAMGSDWHPISFNSYSQRKTTIFVLRYFPNPKVIHHKGSVSFKNFRYVKEVAL